ncbi:MAG TPA: hypothetical protein LFW20_01060 [Rickettsia endosymbiont of Omalisus fontisbellaquei]|nr:hypothetical protein [Rickettsia endosymbiont of Omalisus fontisbellaquei]
METCLIKYFMPYYNKLLKRDFSNVEKFLKKCQKYNINSLGLEIDISSLQTQLFSLVRNAKFRHSKKYCIHKDKERISIKEIFNNKLDTPLKNR